MQQLRVVQVLQISSEVKTSSNLVAFQPGKSIRLTVLPLFWMAFSIDV